MKLYYILLLFSMSKIIFACALLALIGTVISTTCQDGSTCPGTTTCCLSPQGSVGCCPYEKATCCSDGLHCCPNGFTCDLAGGKCAQGNNSFLAFVSLNESTPAVITPAESTVKAASNLFYIDLFKCANATPKFFKLIFKAVMDVLNGNATNKSKAKNFLYFIKNSVILSAMCKDFIKALLLL